MREPFVPLVNFDSELERARKWRELCVNILFTLLTTLLIGAMAAVVAFTYIMQVRMGRLIDLMEDTTRYTGNMCRGFSTIIPNSTC